MNNPRLAQRYAKSLIDIAREFNQLEDVRNDVAFLGAVVKESRDFVLMLESPIIHTDKKYRIISAIAKGRISGITDSFVRLICNKGRESALPGVIDSFMEQYNAIIGLHTAKLTTAVPVSRELGEAFVAKIRESTSYDKVQLETVVDEGIIGGFVLEMEGKLIDNSILRNLHDVHRQFANNDYLHKLR